MANVGPAAWYVRNGLNCNLIPIGQTGGGSGPTTITLTSVNTPANAAIWVCVNESVTTTNGSLSDGGTNFSAAAPLHAVELPTNLARIQVFYKEGCAALNNATLTYTKVASTHAVSISAFYATGVKTSASEDASFFNSTTGTSTAVSLTSNAPAGANELVIAILGYNNASSRTVTPGSIWSVPPYTANASAAAAAQTAGGWVFNGGTLATTYTATISNSSAFAAIIMAVKMQTAPTVGYYGAVSSWTASGTPAAGSLTRNNTPVAIGNGRVWACTVAGTNAASEPAWNLTQGTTTADNTTTWIEVTGQPGVNGDTANASTWLQNKNTVVTQGLMIYDSVSLSLQVVTTAGTTGNGSQPSFSATAGVTTSDNTVTWTSLGLASGFAAWAAPLADLGYVSGFAAAGQNVFVANDHFELTAETAASAYNLFFQTANPPTNIYSVNPASSFPLTDFTAGAQVVQIPNTNTAGSTPSSSIQVQGNVGLFGLTFQAGVLNICYSSGGYQGMMNAISCTFKGAAAMTFNQDDTGTSEFTNCTITGIQNPAVISLGSGTRLINPTINGSFSPTYIFQATLNGGPGGYVSGANLTGLSATSLVQANVNTYSMGFGLFFDRCSMPVGVPIGQNTFGIDNPVVLRECDTGGNVYQNQKWTGVGSLITVANVVRSGGFKDWLSNTPVSWEVATTSFATWTLPFRTLNFPVPNSLLGTNRNITVYGIAFGTASLPTSAQIGIRGSYFGTAGSTQATYFTTLTRSPLAAGVAYSADSTSNWISAAAARVNGHTYSAGDFIFVPDNSRLFYCTVGGAASGSEPAGYATAVDGSTVTDGAATFQAGVRFTMTATFSSPQPAIAGLIDVQAIVANPSATFCLDPKPVLS